MKRVCVLPGGVLLAFAAGAVAKEHPTPKHTPPATPSVFKEVDLEVMRDGVKTTVKGFTIATPESVVTPLEVGTPVPTLYKELMGESAPPFSCSKTACAFTRMPLYNQTNPNLAFVDVPDDIYDHEKNPVGGEIVWVDATGHPAVKINIYKDKPVYDPFYASWLPLGPYKGDPASLGGGLTFISDLCGPTSQAMTLIAALSASTGRVKVKPGSWLQQYFIDAKRPKGQETFPSPLRPDTALAKASTRAMTLEDLQRLVNTAEQLGRDPTTGTDDELIDNKDILSGLELADPKSGGHPYDVRRGAYPTVAQIVDVVKEGYVPMIHMGYYTGQIEPRTGNHVVARLVTFQRTGGHYVAVNGFHDGGTANVKLVIFDPWHGREYTKSFRTLQIKGAKGGDGAPYRVVKIVSSHKELKVKDKWPVWDDDSTNLGWSGKFKVVEDFVAVKIY